MSKPGGRKAQAGEAESDVFPRREQLRAGPLRRSKTSGLSAGASAPFLIAGIGNSSFGDDGFGVEVLRQLERERRERPHGLPDGLRLLHCGTRALQLAWELARPLERVLLINAVERGGPPGRLYLLDLDTEQARLELVPPFPPEPCAGALDIQATLATGRWLAARPLPPVQLLACEPAVLSGNELSPPIRSALGDALEVVQRWLQQASLSL
jgi:hydrogenase maturation protease